jgi:hypothetical protein
MILEKVWGWDFIGDSYEQWMYICAVERKNRE